MGTFGKTLSLISFAVGIVIAILMYAQYTHTQAGVMKVVADNIDRQEFYMRGEDEFEDGPSLSVERTSAPKNGSVARTFEIEHVDAAAELGEIVVDGGSEPDGTPPAVTEEEPPTLAEDATLGETFSFYWQQLSIWLFGEREEKVEMSCTSKRDGGKVCTVVRK